MNANTFAECKGAVFVAARDGNIRRLKLMLDQRSATLVKELVSARTDGATPLVVACRNGHFEVAQYLIEKCHADLEQTGSVTFDGETIEGAPPLWCASAAGNLEIVKLLVSNGANVNATTKTNSTPLRAACFDGHFAIVKYLVKQDADIEIANRHGHTCLMIACYKGHYEIAKYLIGLGANVNRKSVKGNTALHDCAESGSLQIMKLLLAHGASIDVDSYGMTPLLAAAVTGHSHIVEYLISLNFIRPKERIEALELLGATFMDKKRDMLGAANLWRKALRERKATNVPKPKTQSPIAAFGDATEIKTEAELEEVMSDPDAMRIQALIIRERILGPAHPDTSYFIRYRGAVYADAGNIPKCITLWLYALRMQQEILEPLSLMTQSSLSSFAELFSYILSKRISASVPKFVPDLVVVFEKAVKEWTRGCEHVDQRKAAGFDVEKEVLYLHRTFTISLHLACLLALCPPLVDEEMGKKIKRSLYQLLKLKIRGQGGMAPLHLAVSKRAAVVSRSPLCTFPSQSLTEILLELGADPNQMDDNGNTPLHVAASHPSLCQASLITALLAKGAHYDSVNKAGETFMDCYEKNKKESSAPPSPSVGGPAAAVAVPQLALAQANASPDNDNQQEQQVQLNVSQDEEPQQHPLAHIKPLKHINLQCLAARAVNRHKIQFTELDLPRSLIAMVDSHGE